MSDGRWFEIDEDIAFAVKHFGHAASIYVAGGFEADTLGGYRSQMAFLHAMQSGHTALETALVRILELFGEEPPSGIQWHADLIRRAGRAIPNRPAILPEDLSEAADETRRFRHVAMRNYQRFDAERARPAVEAAIRLVTELTAAVARFKHLVDPD